jgi:hypothetical protein
MISARDRRVLAMGAGIITSLVALTRGIPAGLDWQRRTVLEATSMAADLAGARRSVRSLPALRDSLRIRSNRLAALDSTLLSGPSSAAAAADLSSILENIAEDAGIRVSSFQIGADSASPGWPNRVRVRVVGVGDVVALADFLRAVEGSGTPLVVRELVVAQPDPLGPASRPETLRLEILVESIALIHRGAKA